MWDFDRTAEFDRSYRRYEKKHPRELKAVLTNLNRVQKVLRDGANPQKLPFGFIHIEQRGVIAIDQKGGGKNLAQTRLYIYIDRIDQTIHLITIGDKSSQPGDIRTASDYVDDLTSAERGDSHGKENQERPGAGGDRGAE